MEIVLDYRLKERQIDSLKVMYMNETENFTMFGDAVKKRKSKRNNIGEIEINLRKSKRRMEYYMSTTTTQLVKRLYGQMEKEARNMLDKIMEKTDNHDKNNGSCTKRSSSTPPNV